jgi:hypothetical protein
VAPTPAPIPGPAGPHVSQNRRWNHGIVPTRLKHLSKTAEKAELLTSWPPSHPRLPTPHPAWPGPATRPSEWAARIDVLSRPPLKVKWGTRGRFLKRRGPGRLIVVSPFPKAQSLLLKLYDFEGHWGRKGAMRTTMRLQVTIFIKAALTRVESFCKPSVSQSFIPSINLLHPSTVI